MDRLRVLLEQKKQVATTPDDIEKISIIEDLFKDETVFFNIGAETAVGILDFLGVPEEEIVECYNELISLENFRKKPKERIVVEEQPGSRAM